jgi:hypothetical protein
MFWFSDGAEFNTNQELIIWCWCSALARGASAWVQKFLFAAIPHRLIPTAALRKKANAAVTLAIAKAHHDLIAGKHGTRNFYANKTAAQREGTTIAGGWHGGFGGWKGDLKERRVAHNFKGCNYLSKNVCDCCKATKYFKPGLHNDPNTFANFVTSAQWLQTDIDHQEYINITRPENLTPWLAVPGFVKSRVLWELAHVLLLGTGKDICGAVLCDCVS